VGGERGWGRFSGELSKVLAFLEAMKGPPFSGPSLGVELSSEPLPKETPSLNPFQRLGVDDGQGDGHAKATPIVEEGGRVVQSKKKALLSAMGVEGKIQEGFRGIGPDHGFILGWPSKVWHAIWARSRA
jgi:hypothetical protein